MPPLTNILVVDDRAEDRTALESVLAPLGQNLILADSGADALRQLLKTDFAVILLDVQMPLMDGFETARMIRARERSQSVPLIFITGNAMTSNDCFTGYGTVAVDYLLKPVSPDILRWKVQVFVDLHRLRADREAQNHSLALANQALAEAVLGRDRALQERAQLATELSRRNRRSPVCAGCQKIRDAQGQWLSIERHLAAQSLAPAGLSLCPECTPECPPEASPLAAVAPAA